MSRLGKLSVKPVLVGVTYIGWNNDADSEKLIIDIVIR